MEERKYRRYYFDDDLTGSLMCGSAKEPARLIDIGAGGMRVHFYSPVEPGTEVHGRLEIPRPVTGILAQFFVRGKAIRVKETMGFWETAVQFDIADTEAFESAFA